MSLQNALKYPINVIQGDDWTQLYTLSTVFDGVKNPIDLTDITFDGFVKLTREGPVAEQMAHVVIDALAGKVSFGLTDTQTSDLPIGALYYQINKTFNDYTETFLTGVFNVR